MGITSFVVIIFWQSVGVGGTDSVKGKKNSSGDEIANVNFCTCVEASAYAH